MIRRREFITLLGGAAVGWPFSARAQQSERIRRIGVLMWGDENDPGQKALLSAFIQGLSELGWTDGRNVRMDLRWHGSDINRIRAVAQELVGLQPHVILASSTPATIALQQETGTPDRLYGRERSRRQRSRRAARPSGWEHHRLRLLGSIDGRQVA